MTGGPGAGLGQLLTSYGPPGPRGKSGAPIIGGFPDDPGMPVTHDMIVNVEIPAAGAWLPGESDTSLSLRLLW